MFNRGSLLSEQSTQPVLQRLLRFLLRAVYQCPLGHVGDVDLHRRRRRRPSDGGRSVTCPAPGCSGSHYARRDWRVRRELDLAGEVDGAAVQPDGAGGRQAGPLTRSANRWYGRSEAIDSVAPSVVNGSSADSVAALAALAIVPIASAASAATESADEPFTTLGATLSIAGGAAHTNDLRFESKDLLLSAAGTVRLDGSAINLAGQVQLSDELSSHAGRDLIRYTQERGRVTLPATITGTAAAPTVRINVADVAKRALVNRAKEEAQKALKNGLGGLFRKK